MARLLIINADDLGYDPEVTRGILKAMRFGVVTSATLMVNTPFSEEAAAQAKGLSLGLHLNLARHPPVWSAFPNSLLTGGAFDETRAGTLPAEAAEHEALAQLDRLEALVGRPATHVDVHKHLHQQAGIFEGLCAAARARGLPVRSITPQMRNALRDRGVKTNDHFIGDAGTGAYWTLERLADHLVHLPHGVTELMCHPGYAPSKVKSGYSAQREVELATFTSSRASELLENANVQLVDFTVLRGA